jgi:hypothetical protein
MASEDTRPHIQRFALKAGIQYARDSIVGGKKAAPQAYPMLKPHQRHKDNLEHAHWRVNFLLCLLDSHRRLRFGTDTGWDEKEGEYLRRLAAAQADLDRAERLGYSSRTRHVAHAQPSLNT